MVGENGVPDDCFACTPDETRVLDCGCVHSPYDTKMCEPHWETFITWLDDDSQP